MTVARSLQINLDHTRYYHIVSRCVRQAFLCGWDRGSKAKFDHREGWLVERLKAAAIFAIDVAGFAVLANHFHIVAHVDMRSHFKFQLGLGRPLKPGW